MYTGAVGAPIGFHCSACGEWHDELPLSFHVEAPVPWLTASRRQRLRGVLGGEQCELAEHRFVRGLIRLPIVEGADHFEWGVWVSLSRESYDRMAELWESEGREDEPPYFGWVSNELNAYPSSLNLKSSVYTRPVGLRPLTELEPTDHPLAVEQRAGITMARAEELASFSLHPESSAG